MSTYGNMIARIADELGRPELAARIPNAIQSAIRFHEDERFWFSEGESTASTIAGQANYALPDDFVEPDALTVTYSTTVRRLLKRRPWPWMRQHSLDPTQQSIPSDWSYYADQIWLYPIPDAVYTMTMSFLKRQSNLTDYADTNDWMVHGEELIRTRAKYDLLCHTASMSADPGMAQLAMKQAAMLKDAYRDALDDLREKSEQKIASSGLSFDPALAQGGDYNINFE